MNAKYHGKRISTVSRNGNKCVEKEGVKNSFCKNGKTVSWETIPLSTEKTGNKIQNDGNYQNIT